MPDPPKLPGSMPDPITGIDWDKLPAQQESPSLIDWGSLPSAESATPSVGHHNPQTGTIGPDEHPIEHRAQELLDDIRSGPSPTDDRLPERAMRAIGFHGTERGAAPGIGGMMPISGALEGGAQLIHAGTRVPEVKNFNQGEGVANEAIEGGLKTLAGAGPLIAPEAMPMAVPAVATGGAAGTTASEATKFLGGSPESQELAGNIASIAVPAAHSLGKPVGAALQEHAPAIGKTAGTLATIGAIANDATSGRPFNPIDLLMATDPVTSATTGAVLGAGSLIQGLGDIPFADPRLSMEHPGPAAPGPKLLPRGPIQMPAPQVENGPIARPAQVVISRNANTGRMGKQFLPTESTGKPIYNPPTLINTDSNPTPKAPPNVPQTEVGLSSSALKNPPTQSAKPATAAPEASQSESNARPTYKEHLEATIDEYKKLLSLNPNDAEAQKGLKELTDLHDEISQPGYENPFIDPNAPAERRAKPREDIIPNPNGTATDTMPGISKKTEIPVARLENPAATDLSREKNQPYVPVPKRPRENFEQGPQLVDTGKQSRDIDEKGRQQESRQQFEADEQQAAENARKSFYRGNKADVSKKTGKQYNPDTETLQPWADVPWR